MLVKAPVASRPLGAGGIFVSPGPPSSGGVIPEVAPRALFLTFTIPESSSSLRVTALSKGSPRKPSLISRACFISSKASFSSLSVFGGMFFRPGILVDML